MVCFLPGSFLISLSSHVLGSKPIPALERLPKLRLRYLPDSPTAFRRLPFILAGPLKVLHQIFAILIVLVFLIRVPPEFILVQVRPTCQGHHKLLKKGSDRILQAYRLYSSSSLLQRSEGVRLLSTGTT